MELSSEIVQIATISKQNVEAMTRVFQITYVKMPKG